MPAGLSELRVELPEGVVRKVTTAADTADGAAGDGGRDLSWAEGKMFFYVEKAQLAAGLVPMDGTKLLYVGDQLAMEDWAEPPMGKDEREGHICQGWLDQVQTLQDAHLHCQRWHSAPHVG
jgi:hypothetical protein